MARHSVSEQSSSERLSQSWSKSDRNSPDPRFERQARDSDGKSVDEKFDLVLAYDYENHSTPNSETAARSKDQL